MSARISRITFAAEVLLLVFPFSFLLVFLALMDLSELQHIGSVMLVALSGGACLYFAWYLSMIFLKGGARSLQLCPKYVWAFAHLGALLALLGGVIFVFSFEHLTAAPQSDVSPAPILELRGLVTGLPLLVPYVHLTLERAFRAKSSSRWSAHEVSPSPIA